jgi:hypothetical protein
MSKKHFSWLAVAAVAAALIAIFLPRQTSRVDSFEPAPLLPGFAAQANDIDWLRVTAAGDEVLVTLERGEPGWRVAEAAGYAADWAVLRPLLAGLARAEVVEAKTSNPDYYDRLGVRGVAAPEASGLRLEFRPETGLPAVILGNTAQGRDGQYARLADAAGSVLIDRELDLPKRREDWLDRAIVDLAEDEVVEVVITHADGETVRASKVSADDEDFSLDGVAEGFEPTSNWAVNSLAGALSALRLDAVAAESEIDWTGATRYRAVTADGLDVSVDVVTVAADGDGAQDEAHWLRVAAGLYTTGLDTGVDAAADDAAARERAEGINRRVAGWAYRVPEYKTTNMVKRMADLVRAVDDGS